MVDKILNVMPNMAPDGPLGTEKKGLLSPLGDPIGQVLDKGLRPVGVLTGGICRPPGQALLDVEAKVKEDFAYKKHESKAGEDLPGEERIGGKAQTVSNPLGL
ncbi:Hypothetical protein R9X50_00674000 [Acrodontium crateriforme]|uniref:Uncharacterized protein n=1 Tax=Acrodontium crateriforme TaxID=150365 RepID=A0AAQ3MDH4_9PEZI|nr:Hypothetical protein R9X50_00674000 [Acrodontium crateriforme]